MRAWLERYFRPRERIDPSPPVADEIVPTTCYMCACRCGIRVHKLDGRIRYIDGNSRHPVNRGVICGKGAAGIMQHLSPARLRSPMLRVGERGEGKLKEIGWGEALDLAVSWLAPVRATDPRKLAFFTGRDQSQSLTSLWATSFGTPNWAAHGGFCSVNMAAAGLYSIGYSFWEFGAPDWDRARYFMLWGVAEDHASNPIKIGLDKLKRNGAKFVSVNPVRTGYGVTAEETRRSLAPYASRPGWSGLAAPRGAKRVFQSPGPIYEPEGQRADYWRIARAQPYAMLCSLAMPTTMLGGKISTQGKLANCTRPTM